MKKRQDVFSSYLDKVYNVCKMLEQEGYSRGEARYFEIVATILLRILDSLRAIRFLLCFFAGALLAYMIEHFFML